MKAQNLLDDHLKAIHGLPKWTIEHDLGDKVLSRMRQREQVQINSIQSLVAASILVCLLSGLLFLAGLKEQQEVTNKQLKQISNIYAVNNLNY